MSCAALRQHRLRLQVLKEHKADGQQHVAWIKALRAPFDELKVYVKKHHIAGPAWNAHGIPVAQFRPGAQSSATAAPARPSAPSAQGALPLSVLLYWPLSNRPRHHDKLVLVGLCWLYGRGEVPPPPRPPPPPCICKGGQLEYLISRPQCMYQYTLHLNSALCQTPQV